MTAAANPGQFQNPGYQNPGNQTPWGTTTWGGVPFWHPAGMSRPVCIALMILGFAFWWPIGLAILAFGVASGRIGCGSRRRAWMAQQQQNPQGNTQGGWTPSPAPWDQWRGWCSSGNGGGGKPPASSGNRAFDEYRAETLHRLEDEQKDFSAFLERLRFARDKNEFDQFMADRRPPPSPPAVHDDPTHG